MRCLRKYSYSATAPTSKRSVGGGCCAGLPSTARVFPSLCCTGGISSCRKPGQVTCQAQISPLTFVFRGRIRITKDTRVVMSTKRRNHNVAPSLCFCRVSTRNKASLPPGSVVAGGSRLSLELISRFSPALSEIACDSTIHRTNYMRYNQEHKN